MFLSTTFDWGEPAKVIEFDAVLALRPEVVEVGVPVEGKAVLISLTPSVIVLTQVWVSAPTLPPIVS